MNTLDSLLPIISSNIRQVEHKLPKKDKKILLSLSRQLTTGNFLTENQANLFVKILKENLTAMKTIVSYTEECIEANLWSKKFRIINVFRKIYPSKEDLGHFIVEFNFNSKLKDKIQKIMFLNNNCFSRGTKYYIPLTEEAIFSVISAFKNDGFEIDGKILAFFQEIEKVKNSSITDFDIFSLKSEKLKKIVEEDVGAISTENLILLNDRKFRYQYQIFEKNQENSLTAKIAYREKKDIFVSNEKFSLEDVVESLKNLKRFPVLVVFDGHNSKKDKKSLDTLKLAQEKLGIKGNIGIYFRYDKAEDLESFNNELALLQYNKNLSADTVIAGISNSKLPKFMLNLGWKPGAIISFTNNFKSNKSAVYFSDVDLIIYYGSSKPLDEKIYEIL